MATGFIPIPPFLYFTAFTPAVPNLYWDVYSEEQRYFALCEQFHKLVCYANTIAERLNAITDEYEQAIADFKKEVQAQLDAQQTAFENALDVQNAKVEAELKAMRTYIDERFDAIAEGVELYDVTTGTYRPSKQAMRKIYSMLAYDHIGDRAIVSDIADNLTVAQLGTNTVYHTAWSNRRDIILNDQVPIIEGMN